MKLRFIMLRKCDVMRFVVIKRYINKGFMFLSSGLIKQLYFQNKRSIIKKQCYARCENTFVWGKYEY